MADADRQYDADGRRIEVAVEVERAAIVRGERIRVFVPAIGSIVEFELLPMMQNGWSVVFPVHAGNCEELLMRLVVTGEDETQH